MAHRMQQYSLRKAAMGAHSSCSVTSRREESPESAPPSSATMGDDSGITSSVLKEIDKDVNDPSDLKNFLRTDKPMGSFKSCFLALSMEADSRIKQERIIMIAESYALFAALFLNGVWFIWEFGNSREFENEALHRAFEACCAVDMIATCMVTMYGCFIWIMSNMFSSTQNSWTYGVRRYLGSMHHLVSIIAQSTLIAILIAVHNRMQGTVEGYVVLVSSILYIAYMHNECGLLLIEQAPLELYHFPLYAQLLNCSALWFTKKDQIKKSAEARAEELKLKASKHEKKRKQEKRSIDDLRDVLLDACQQLGKSDTDVSPYLEKLQEDWYDSIDLLRGENVDVLNKYMPRALAKTFLEVLNSNKD